MYANEKIFRKIHISHHPLQILIQKGSGEF